MTPETPAGFVAGQAVTVYKDDGCFHPHCWAEPVAIAQRSEHGRERVVCDRHLRAELVSAERFALPLVLRGLSRASSAVRGLSAVD